MDLIARSLALTTAVRLGQTVEWTQSKSGHSSILNSVNHIASRTDHCTPTLTFTKNYKLTIPSRDDCNNLPHLKLDIVNIFTNGSQLDDKLAGGVFSSELQIETSFRLADHCRISLRSDK